MPTLKDQALAFLKLLIAGHTKEAYDEHVGPGFVHHNPYFASDAAALLTGMADSERHFPNKLFEIQHALEDGDLVAVHSWLRFTINDRGMAVVHLLRFENGKVVEFWDVGQAVPDEVANELGMF